MAGHKPFIIEAAKPGLHLQHSLLD